MTAPLLSKIPNFNPRAVPVLGTDAHLPAVALERLTAQALRTTMAQDNGFVPELALEPSFVDRPLRDAAVLIPIVLRSQPTVLLTQRTPELKNHAGQVAFAGGKIDDTDPTPQAAALREAWEEVGLEAQHVEVIGNLPHYTTGTAFRITPVVALVSPNHSLALNPAEVAQAFEVPLAFLMNPANHQRHRVTWDFGNGPVDRDWFSMRFQEGVRDDFIWGATAGMIRNLYRRLV
jgi:8-oxo-dGTP pyrophosphatase MutT (NUDIX family)